MNCANCGQPLPPGSHKDKVYCCRKCVRQAANKYRAQTRYLGVNCHHRAVKVVDEKSELTYFISKNEFALYKKDYAAMPGVTVFIDGKPVDTQLELL